MALFNLSENDNNSTPTLTSVKQHSSFNILDSLPHPVTVRGENLDFIFRNSAAQNNRLFLEETRYYSKAAQQQIRLNSTLLFQQKKIKQLLIDKGKTFKRLSKGQTCFGICFRDEMDDGIDFDPEP